MSNTTVGREPIQVVQIDQDFCSLTYGETPCSAEVGVTGTRKCFNTRETCQDPANYDRSTLTLTFSQRRPGAPDDLYVRPSLQDVTSRPTQLNIGSIAEDEDALGTRESVTATFEDHPDTDRQVDKYLSERTYDPLERGTFWNKWVARNPYYQNRPMRVYDGYAGQALAEMKSRSYFLDTISGPDSGGRVTVKAKDILKLADDKRAQAPNVTEGVLENDINASQNTVELEADASDYPAPGSVRINDEIIAYTGVTDNTGDTITLTGCTRGANNTVASSHTAGDNAQWCLEFSDTPVWEVVRDLLQDYANIDPAFIPYSDWQDEGNTWLTQFNLTSIITEPTGVKELLGELSQQCLFFIWWDSQDQEIKLRGIRPATGTVPEINDDDNILADSVSIKQDPDQRVSQIWLYYNRFDPTESLDETRNFSSVRILVDSDAQSADQYGETRVKKIYSRWLTTQAQALYVSNRLLAAYRDNPRYIQLRLDAKDRDLWLADLADVTHRNIVDDTGAELTERWQVVKAEEVRPGEVVQYDLVSAQIFGNLGFWMAEDAPDYDNATPAQKADGAWWADDDGTLGSNNRPAYDWI